MNGTISTIPVGDRPYAETVQFMMKAAYYGAMTRVSNSYEVKCVEIINQQDLFIFLLIPAAICTFFIWLMRCKTLRKKFGSYFKQSRQNKELFGLSDRFSYAAAFGALAFLCFEIAVKKRYVIKDVEEGPVYIQILAAVLSIIVYTCDYFPVFVSLAEKSVVGDAIGTLYIFCLASLYIVRKIGCFGLQRGQLLLFVQNLPIFMCLVYLSVSFPARFLISLRKTSEETATTNIERSNAAYDGIRKTTHGKQVILLLTKVRVPRKPRKKSGKKLTTQEKCRQLFQSILDRICYRNIPDFRYSVRVVCVVTVGLILIYMITVEILTTAIPVLADIKAQIWGQLVKVTAFETEGDVEQIQNFTVIVLHVTWDTAVAVEACVLAAVFLSFAIGVGNIIHTLTSYRRYRMELHRGDNSHIPNRSQLKNTDVLVGSTQFAGYQVGFMVFAYVIQALLLFFVMFGITVFVLTLKYKTSGPLFRIVLQMWPTIIFTILVDLLHTLFAKYIFLQKKGQVLALRNRRCYHVFLYFLFIFDIIIGTMRCPYRILKGLLVGSLTLARLDHSSLSRRFELFDTGFSAYIGFLHMENMAEHPVLITFVRLLQARPGSFSERSKHQDSVKYVNQVATSTVELGAAFWKDEQLLRKARAKYKWFLLYTLVKNPQLQFLRQRRSEWLED